MATKNFRSTVLEPTSEFAHGDKLRFTALATVGEVLKGSFSETTIGEDGVYSIDLQYGKHRIDYKPYEGVWRHFADVEVNADTLSTTLQDLALASAPVTDEAVLVLQGILADAEEAKTAAETAETAAEAALASIDTTISEAEAGYPLVVNSMFSQKIYVNNVSGNDENDGKTAAQAKSTLKNAIESTPDSSRITVSLIKTADPYLINQNITLGSRRVTISTEGASAATGEAGYATLIQMQDTSVTTEYASSMINLSDGSFVVIYGVHLETAKFTDPRPAYNAYRNTLFQPSYSYNASIILSSVTLTINNASLCHMHSSGSLTGAIDLYASSLKINALPALSITGGARTLFSAYGGAFPFKFFTSALTNNSGVDMSSLIGVDESMLQTNIAITISRNGAEYINFDADAASDAGISADVFDAALAEQQADDLFKTEKSIALQIMADFNLGTGEREITGSDISDVRAYIQSIDPAKGLKAGHLQRAKIPRPSIFDRYS